MGNGEHTARLQNQLWLISRCLRLRILPVTLSNLRLPECINEAAKNSVRFYTLRKMKRGLRALLEKERRTTKKLYQDLSDHYPADREELQRCRTSAFSLAYRRESDRCNRKLAHLVGTRRQQRPSQPGDATGGSLTNCRITDKTGELSEVEKAVLSRGPKFALAAGIDEDTRKPVRDPLPDLPTSFAGQLHEADSRESAQTATGPFPATRGARTSTCPPQATRSTAS